MCPKIVTGDRPHHLKQGYAGLISMSQTDIGVNSAVQGECRGITGWGLKHNCRDLGNQKTRRESFQDLHFGFNCMNLLLGLAPVSDPISLQVRISGSFGFIQKAVIWGDAYQIPGCLDLVLGLDFMIYYVVIWGYLTVFFLWKEFNVK